MKNPSPSLLIANAKEELTKIRRSLDQTEELLSKTLEQVKLDEMESALATPDAPQAPAASDNNEPTKNA